MLRGGVIGVGHLGRHHARLLAANEAVTLTAVADTDLERARVVAGEYGARAFGDAEERLPHVGLVSIAVPTTLHHALAGMALSAGKHVLLEKPIARNLEEADELIRLATEGGVVFQVGHSERFNPAIRGVRHLIRQPGFVEIHRIGPFAGRGTDVDVILDLMIHDLDLLLDWVEAPVVSVDAVGVPVLSPRVDIANARIRFADGCVANVTASRSSLEPLRKIRIFAPNRYISIDARAQEVVVLRRDLEATSGAAGPMAGIVPEPVRVERGEPLKAEIDAFVESVCSGAAPEVGGAEARRALELALRVKSQL